MASADLAFDVIARDKASKTLDDVGSGVDGLGKKLAGFAKAGVAAVAAVVTALAAVGTGFALEKSRADALLAGQVGAGPQQAKELGKVSGQLYAQGWAESIGQAADAVRATIENQLIPKDAGAAAIEAMSTRTAALAAQMGDDFGRVGAAVSTMLRTGVAKDATQAFDLLTIATQKGVNKSQDLLDTMIEYSVQFQALGIDAPKALGLMVQALGAGARNADVAADAIKEFAIRSKDGSALSAKAFAALNLDARKMFQTFARGGPEADAAMKLVIDRLKAMKDPVERDAAAVALFGTKAEDLQAALFAFDPTTAVDALGKVTGASDAFIDSQTSAGQRVDALWRGMMLKIAEFADTAVKKFDEAAPRIQLFVDTELKNLKDALVDLKDNVLAGVTKGFDDIKLSVDSNTESWRALKDGIAEVVEVAGPVFGWLAGVIGTSVAAAIDWLATLITWVDRVIDGLFRLDDLYRRLTGKEVLKQAFKQGTPSFGGGFQERAHGGPVTKGRPYIVGEHRPELFVPDQNGMILPSVPSGSSGGGGVQVVELRATGFGSGLDRLFLSWLQGALRGNPGVRLVTA